MKALKTLAFGLAVGSARLSRTPRRSIAATILCARSRRQGAEGRHQGRPAVVLPGRMAASRVWSRPRQCARRLLGAKVEIVKVNSANRFEFLAQGQIDLMIASATDTAERRQVVGFVHPNYYSSGYNILLPNKVKATKWDEMAGQTICAIQGAWYNKPAQEKFKIELLAFAGNAEVDSALQQGRCIGVLSDDNLINVQLADPKWADYHMPLPTQDDAPGALPSARPISTSRGACWS